MRGIAALPVIAVIVVVLAVFLAVGSFFKENKQGSAPSQNHSVWDRDVQNGIVPSGAGQGHQEESEGAYGMKKPFYSKDGVLFQHYWPGDGSFSNEETEILVINGSNLRVQVTSFDMSYMIGGQSYSQKSGTWEKFPSQQSWDKIEYINISPQYYKDEPLILEPGQKGKLHWHIQFGPNPLDGRQNVKVKLTLLKGSETINIDEQFSRDSGTVFSKENH